ncbi:VOC family protein [Neomicrococcus lactis]
MIFVNLPRRDAAKSDAFYQGLGFEKNELFSNEVATSWKLSEQISVMALNEEFFNGFLVNGDNASFGEGTKQMLNAISAESEAEVDEFVANATANGGSVYRPAKSDAPGMYSAAVADPDGHVWEIVYMDMSAWAEGNVSS